MSMTYTDKPNMTIYKEGK